MLVVHRPGIVGEAVAIERTGLDLRAIRLRRTRWRRRGELSIDRRSEVLRVVEVLRTRLIEPLDVRNIESPSVADYAVVCFLAVVLERKIRLLRLCCRPPRQIHPYDTDPFRL